MGQDLEWVKIGGLSVDYPKEIYETRLDERPDSEWGGGKPTERELIARLHQTKEDIPKNAISIDATASVARVVDEIVRQTEAHRKWFFLKRDMLKRLTFWLTKV